LPATSTIEGSNTYYHFSLQVDIHKPVTSKPGNSEVYVVCKCLLAEVSDNILSLIQSALGMHSDG